MEIFLTSLRGFLLVSNYRTNRECCPYFFIFILKLLLPFQPDVSEVWAFSSFPMWDTVPHNPTLAFVFGAGVHWSVTFLTISALSA